jgi:large subunit ribosomal protein L10
VPTKEKIESLEQLKRRLGNARTAVLTEYRGLTVRQLGDLRRRLRDASATCQVVKNRIAKLAVADSPFRGLRDQLTGPTAIVLSAADPVAVAKALQTFARTNQRLLVKAGYVEGAVLPADALRALADLPSREALRSHLVAAVQGPMAQLCSGLTAPLRDLTYIMEERSKRSESAPKEE